MSNLANLIHDFLERLDKSSSSFSPELFDLLTIPALGINATNKIWYGNVEFNKLFNLTPAFYPVVFDSILETDLNLFKTKTCRLNCRVQEKISDTEVIEANLIGYRYGCPKDLNSSMIIALLIPPNPDEKLKSTFLRFISRPLQGSTVITRASNQLQLKIRQVEATLANLKTWSDAYVTKQ